MPGVDTGFDMDAFRQSLADTIAWLRSRARGTPRETLFSPELWPSGSPRPENGEFAWWQRALPASFVGSDGVDFAVACAFVTSRRRTALATIRSASPPLGDIGDGRLMLVHPQNTWWDCLDDESKGLVGSGGLPAWDTWVAHVPDRQGPGDLIAWIPPWYLGLAQAAMDSDPEQTFIWADPQDVPARAVARFRRCWRG